MSTLTKAPAKFVRMFKPMFAHAVATGKKRQTVRPFPSRMPEAGDSISLRCWTGRAYHSPQRVLREAIITRVEEVEITAVSITVCKDNGRQIRLVQRDCKAFAKLDGFVSWNEMREWFQANHGLPFTGILICW